MYVSSETIYYRKRNVLHHSLVKHLRPGHSLSYAIVKEHSRKGERGTTNIVNGVWIHEGPKHIENRRSLAIGRGSGHRFKKHTYRDIS